MRRTVVNPSGDEQKDLIQDVVTDLVLGTLGFLGLVLSTAWVHRYLVGTPIIDPANLLYVLLGAATLVIMTKIHSETAMPGEGTFWMTRRTKVGTVCHGLVYGYLLLLMGMGFGVPPFRDVPVWIYNVVWKFLL